MLKAETRTGGNDPRPKGGGRRIVGAYVEEQTWAEFNALAQKQGLTSGELLRRIIRTKVLARGGYHPGGRWGR